MEKKQPRTHAVLLASPGMGHLKPMLELGKRLVKHHDLEITLFIVTNDGGDGASGSKSEILKSSDEFLHIHLVSPPQQDVMASALEWSLIRKLVMTMRACVPVVRAAISSMPVAPSAIIVDLFGTDFWDMADELRMLKFAFMTTSALYLAAFISVPYLVDKLSQKEYEELRTIDIPNCKTVAYEDVFGLANRDDPDHVFARPMATNFINADGVLVNTWHDLEPNTVSSLGDGRLLGKLYPIGPLTEQAAEKKLSTEDNGGAIAILEWLDKQPGGSVLYVSFGSGWSLTGQQTHELALGLESSKQRFIWVSRPPTDEVSEYFFSGGDGSGALDYLPDGFVARTKGVGLVVPMWAPQAQILAHASIGGFLTHCGWNSTLESVTNGVPMIAWPLYGDQFVIAAILTEDLEVAIRPAARTSSGGGGAVGREEIRELVVKLMEGGEGNPLRARAKALRGTADRVLEEQKTGSAKDSLHQFAAALRSGPKRPSKLRRLFVCCRN
uniref:Glycosyltransferase n=1 Tax=Kalanchoe fedtschenkoi TaxID=63787 RepID=A0A7N0RB17_KALFE